VTKTKKRKKTKEKRVFQQLAPPGGVHPVSDSFSEIDPKYGYWKWYYRRISHLKFKF
jgi:hypothetical protein